jgi:bacillithiol biosynthesis cysteine-adding enzyme BshC
LEEADLAAATRKIVDALFGQYGLVVIDGDDAALKAKMYDAFKDELLQNSSHTAIEHTNEALGKDYKLQVNPREINLFYLDKGVRNRIVREGDQFVTLSNGAESDKLAFSKDELLVLLKSNPEKFSPNVVLRPLYQETILPNLAYIGGGGELAYWFQLKGVFEHHEVNFPMLLLRNSVLWIDNSTRKRLASLELTHNQLFSDTDALIAAHVKSNAAIDVSLESQKASLQEMFAAIEEKATAVDPTLTGSVKAEQQKQLKSLESLEARMMKAEKRKQETAVNQIRTTKQKLFPNNSLQERQDNLSSFYLRYGAQFIQILKDELDVLDSRFVILEEQEA